MIVREIYEKIIPEIEKKVAEGLSNGSGFSELAAIVHEWVNKLGVRILEQIAEDADKAFKDSAERKRHWQIVRKDTRGILTAMGQVNITRNYYRHKKTGEYSHLGAGWIKAGQNYLPKSISILDTYHRNKYVRKAAGGDDIQMRRLLDALRAGDRIATAKELKACYEKAETEGQRKRVLEARRYLYENWRSIENATKYPDVIGCSAEGHVSHVLSERLSSRPMGWSLTGSEQMSRLRAFIFNGGNLYAALKKTHDNEPGIPRKTVNSIRRRVMKSFENIGNIPVLQMAGRTSRAYLVIRGIQRGNLMY